MQIAIQMAAKEADSMAETKYGKFIITDTDFPPIHPRTKDSYQYNTLWIHEKMPGELQGAFYLETNLVRWPGETTPQTKPHKHDFDEYIIFMGTNPDDPQDLCGEVEFWLGGEEKHILTRTCAIFIPRGMYHCPFKFTRVDRPIVFVTTGPSNTYVQSGFSTDPRWAGLAEGHGTQGP
jgi:hypothetical protein